MVRFSQKFCNCFKLWGGGRWLMNATLNFKFTHSIQKINNNNVKKGKILNELLLSAKQRKWYTIMHFYFTF